MILLANEFLDALPIRQFVRRDLAWTERHVRSRIAFAECPAGPGAPNLDAPGPGARDLGAPHPDAPNGAHPGNPDRRVPSRPRPGPTHVATPPPPPRAAPPSSWTTATPNRLRPRGDSLQALREGRPAKPLAEPGVKPTSPPTSISPPSPHASPRRPASEVHGPHPARPLPRRGSASSSAPASWPEPNPHPKRAAALVHAAQRLAEPDRMGALFKAICPLPAWRSPSHRASNQEPNHDTRSPHQLRPCKPRTASSPAEAASALGPWASLNCSPLRPGQPSPRRRKPPPASPKHLGAREPSSASPRSTAPPSSPCHRPLAPPAKAPRADAMVTNLPRPRPRHHHRRLHPRPPPRPRPPASSALSTPAGAAPWPASSKPLIAAMQGFGRNPLEHRRRDRPLHPPTQFLRSRPRPTRRHPHPPRTPTPASSPQAAPALASNPTGSSTWLATALTASKRPGHQIDTLDADTLSLTRPASSATAAAPSPAVAQSATN